MDPDINVIVVLEQFINLLSLPFKIEVCIPQVLSSFLTYLYNITEFFVLLYSLLKVFDVPASNEFIINNVRDIFFAITTDLVKVFLLVIYLVKLLPKFYEIVLRTVQVSLVLAGIRQRTFDEVILHAEIVDLFLNALQIHSHSIVESRLVDVFGLEVSFLVLLN